MPRIVFTVSNVLTTSRERHTTVDVFSKGFRDPSTPLVSPVLDSSVFEGFEEIEYSSYELVGVGPGD
ncbi:hypothetical protein RH858_10950 [Halalkaliarchaeum sp. AArc-GB]|uniref:hypothetical protein n=1 Tax=Halalkaliarchaeum sp. AArc-GB TaxID=3074078 RepID=UPI00286295B9|nr:hypothetical protein [Halalkaliarchaeum sp. AArc-GB]MDR5673657.1 hypothetical protein [Halalkaliarchaeum sp. AArc-GB]